MANGRKDIIQIRRYHSPCGDLILGSHDNKLCLCDWATRKNRNKFDKRLQQTLQAEYVAGESDVIVVASRQLDEYFTTKRTSFDIPLLFAGSDFQKVVWSQLTQIPYGKTLSYGELAAIVGCPKSVRAVANAVGANAISIFVPCHRVLGGDNKLTGYAGGLTTKSALLNLEHHKKN